MIRSALVMPLLFGCSVRHLEGHDRYSETCVDGEAQILLELGNQDIDCTATAAKAGQIRLQFAAPDPFLPPINLQMKDFTLAQWCPQEGACLEVED